MLSRFSVEILHYYSTEKFCTGNFCVSENVWNGEKLKKNRVMEMSNFSVGNYLSHSAEKFRKEPFEVSEKLEYRKVLCITGLCQDVPSKFLVSQYREIS